MTTSAKGTSVSPDRNTLRHPFILLVGAWLLWEHFLVGGPGTEVSQDYWRILGAWPQFERCEAEREAHVRERAARVGPGARVERKRDTVSTTVGEGKQLVIGVSDLLCLPDTVTDPRNQPEK
jgi:hypothetical protein